ncbi:TPA: RNA-binding protein [Streptococcus suis]|nr:RNA-binding protein [Streptococcus suis]MBS8026223.1 RNA-binding protein [Streptococcus suis]MCK4074528.1 RNA-binding protein [Streptococcus suis]NQH64988.1 RNA-binding protein [Streptococcus suis]NRH16138.1 RNA-binding protein [Streptococcus suis]
MGNGEYLPLSLERNYYMLSFISWLIILFAGFLYLMLRISEIKEKRKQATILRLDLPIITSDLEQVIEKTATITGQKLIFDNRYIRYLQSSPNQDSHLVSFPIMLSEKIDSDTERYLTQVFTTQLNKYLSDSTTYTYWSDKEQNLHFTYQFGDMLRYNNQYYLNLQITFSHNGS